MGVQDRDWYRDEHRRRQGLPQERDRRYYRRWRPEPMNLVQKAVTWALLAILAAIAYRYLR